MQLFQVSSANEWKTINIRSMFTERDEEVFVKCSTWTADGQRIICAVRNAVLVSNGLCVDLCGSTWFTSSFLPLLFVHCCVRTEKTLICVLSVSQVFDVETSDMLLEIRTNRLSMVQYCHACPTSNLLAIAFSNYAVEVKCFTFILYTLFSSFLAHCLNLPKIKCVYGVFVYQLWDLEANKKKADCSGHLSWVQRVQFSPDGSQLLSCSDDQTIRVNLLK